MLPAYRVEVLEYTDYTEDSEGVTKSKPHIIFDDPELEPLAEILNWQFPDAKALAAARTYWLRPWHPAVSKRAIAVYFNTCAVADKIGNVVITQRNTDNIDIATLEISLAELIEAYDIALDLAAP